MMREREREREGGGGGNTTWTKARTLTLPDPTFKCVNCPTRHPEQTARELGSQRQASNALRSIRRRGTPQLEMSEWSVNSPLGRLPPSSDYARGVGTMEWRCVLAGRTWWAVALVRREGLVADRKGSKKLGRAFVALIVKIEGFRRKEGRKEESFDGGVG